MGDMVEPRQQFVQDNAFAASVGVYPVVPREWYLVPLKAIDDAIDKIKDGTIAHYSYDPKTARRRQVD